ncbi:glutathione synthase [Candidatus Phycosocius spiralis]|uniref:Glutathione synthetase n=1 Tax=Candidatus Phycosocius spiralis TaxID=2815099 RepID=A0ABQ4PTT3_9PROT|nr:glutathione synthase [Candidatus Phycosocius spiralis]GIU66420.1 glutathione synthetase [Candidatus Phycosocius spiralis]
MALVPSQSVPDLKRLRVAIQMDPIERVNIDGDTTFAMAEAAQSRGFELWVYGVETLSWCQGQVTAHARPAIVRRIKGDHVTLGEPVTLDLERDVDVILMRQDPPFDMAYITAAHILEFLKDKTLVVNDPFWVRSSPEKIVPLLFPDLMPPTLVSRDPAAIKAFQAKHKDIVVKPLFGNAGAGVFRIKPDDGNFAALLDLFFSTSRDPIMVQAFVPGVFAGDKRIILIDGKPAGAINRVPKGNDIRSNLAVGGTAHPVELSDTDLAICRAIGPTLKERGLLFVGIDVIAGRLTEINVTSPTGALALKEFTGVDCVSLMWDAILGKLL